MDSPAEMADKQLERVRVALERKELLSAVAWMDKVRPL